MSKIYSHKRHRTYSKARRPSWRCKMVERNLVFRLAYIITMCIVYYNIMLDALGDNPACVHINIKNDMTFGCTHDTEHSLSGVVSVIVSHQWISL